MHSKLLNRREFLWGLGLSALSSSLLLQDTQVRANKTKRSPSVLVLGAGLSGLYTALLLERAGIKVVVLEGRDRKWWARLYFRQYSW
jgi:monoamine oxidase